MTNKSKKIIRITTVPRSLKGLLTGQIEFMSEYYELIAVSSEKEKLKEYAKEVGVNHYFVPLTRKITPFTDLKALFVLYRILRKEKPFIVHSHTPKAGTIGMLAAWFARVPNRLHTIAGLPLLVAKGPKRKLLDFVEKLTYGAATMIYPNSYGLEKIIIDQKYTKPSKLKVLAKGSSNGIDTTEFDPSKYSDSFRKNLRKELGFAQNDKVFVFVGRLVTDKGINELIKAFTSLAKDVSKAKLLLLGMYEKDLDPILPETEDAIDNHPDINFVGWQNDVRPYFAISDFLAFPSYREGFPNVVMQAAAMNLPSIVTDINGCNEIIEDKVNGMVIPVEDSQAIEDAMRFLINNPDKAQFFKENARQMIVSRYERQFVWEEILKEYKFIESQKA